MNIESNKPINYECKCCDFKCTYIRDFERHKTTNKHKTNLLIYDDNEFQPKSKYFCDKCNKFFKDRSGLWKHNKKCLPSNLIDQDIKKENNQIIENTIEQHNQQLTLLEFMKQQSLQNQDFQKEIFGQIMDLVQKCVTTTNINNSNINNGNINNNNYNQFNIQMYLNETCKNAMTIDEFLDYLQPTLQELEDTARLGYVEGITRIIMRGLKDLEEELRPFHCSDLKRESLFVKNPDGEWEKETEEKPLMLKFVKAVARKNFNNVNEWRKLHPNCRYHDSKSNDMFNQIMLNSTSGRTEEEQKASYEKIIKNITKEVVIDKSKKNKNKVK
jgi:hypothetical protein